MLVPSDVSKSPSTRILLLVTAAAGLFAAIAAAPSASIGKETVSATFETGGRPLARGPALRVGRAFDAEDEDCVLIVKKIPDSNGQARVKRMVSCAN